MLTKQKNCLCGKLIPSSFRKRRENKKKHKENRNFNEKLVLGVTIKKIL